MLNRDGVLLEVDGIPAQPNGFAAPQTVECRQHDRRFNQRPLYAGEKLVDFILVIKSRLEAVLARTVYLIRWIHGKLVCLYRIFQRPMNEGMIVNHRVGLAKYNYLKDAGITSLEDAEKHRLMLADMKSRLEDADGKIREAVSQKKTVSDFYALYENQMKSDFQVLLEQAKAEMENIRREEERQKAEKERRDLQAENKMQDRDRSGFLR